MTSKRKLFLSSPAVKKTTIFFTIILLLLYIVSHLFYLSLFTYFSNDKSDYRLKHELEPIRYYIQLSKDSLSFDNFKEFNEENFNEITEDPLFLQIYDDDRNILFRSNNLKRFYPIPLTYSTSNNKFIFADITLENAKLRTCMMKIQLASGNHFYIQLSSINALFDQVIKRIFIFDLFTLPIVILIMAVVGIYFVRKLYLPLHRIIDLADDISAKNLNERLMFKADPDDVTGRLKSTLNSLFERLENQIREISNFTDNASHQLMTPLTAIQTELEFIIKKDRTAQEYKETLLIMKEQTSRMINIVKQLLLLTHNERLFDNADQIFNIGTLFKKEIIPIYRHHENLEFNIGDSLYLKGNIEFISMMISNLLDNAIKYSPDNSPVIVDVFSRNDKLILSVDDLGIGIKDSDKEKIFQRFYRADSMERRGIKGYGLGLSLVKSIVESMNGEITVDTKKEKGVKFIIQLPRVIIE